MLKPLSSIPRILRNKAEGIESALSTLWGMPIKRLRGRTIRCLFEEFLVSKLGWWLKALAFMVSPGL